MIDSTITRLVAPQLIRTNVAAKKRKSFLLPKVTYALKLRIYNSASKLFVSVALCMTMLAITPQKVSAQIGRSEITLNTLRVTLVYPTETQVKIAAFGSIAIDVAVDAPPSTSTKRHLIVMSHGAGGSTLSDHTMAARFASAGFVVAQPLHEGDNYRDSAKSGPTAWVTRPQEISDVIDALAAHPIWGAVLKLDRVGVHGMSAGAVSGIMLAGGQWRLLSLIQHCTAAIEEDAGFCFNGVADPVVRAQRAAQYASARGVPEILLPASIKKWQGGSDDKADPRKDSRIAVVTLTVPVAAIFSKESLTRLKIPIGVVAASADTMLKPKFHSDYLLKSCNTCVLLDDVPRATHLDMLHPLPSNIVSQMAKTQSVGAEINHNFNHARRLEAYDRIVTFQLMKLKSD